MVFCQSLFGPNGAREFNRLLAVGGQLVRFGHYRIVPPRIHRGHRSQVQRSRRQLIAGNGLGQRQQMAAFTFDIFVCAGLLHRRDGRHEFHRPLKEQHCRICTNVCRGLLVYTDDEGENEQALHIRWFGVETDARANAEQRVTDADERLPRCWSVSTVFTGRRRSRRNAPQRTENVTQSEP